MDQAVVYSYARELKSHGSVMLPAHLVFARNEIEQIDAIQSNIPEEKVTVGDAGDFHNIYVRRLMTDKAGELPTLVNRPYSDRIISLLCDDRRTSFFSKLFGSASGFLRRCQINRLVEGSFVGLHLDAESNPDYEYSAILQLGSGFQGGEFVVYPDHEDIQVYYPTYGTVLVTTCKFRHEVKRVLACERKSLVYFYSQYSGPNRREPQPR